MKRKIITALNIILILDFQINSQQGLRQQLKQTKDDVGYLANHRTKHILWN